MKEIYRREEILKAERMLRAYEIYLREIETMDNEEEKRKKKFLFNENMIQCKLKSNNYISSIVILKDLNKKLKGIENKISDIKVSISNNKIFRQNAIMNNVYRSILTQNKLNCKDTN